MSQSSEEGKRQVILAKGVKELAENMVALIEYEQLNAKLIRAKFLSLVNVGFTEAQALELCRKS